jgi:hypothetical protein
MKLQTICLTMSEICQEVATGASHQLNGSKAEHPIFSSFPIHWKSTAFHLFDLIFPLELRNDSIMFIIDQEVEGKPVTTHLD